MEYFIELWRRPGDPDYSGPPYPTLEEAKAQAEIHRARGAYPRCIIEVKAGAHPDTGVEVMSWSAPPGWSAET